VAGAFLGEGAAEGPEGRLPHRPFRRHRIGCIVVGTHGEGAGGVDAQQCGAAPRRHRRYGVGEGKNKAMRVLGHKKGSNSENKKNGGLGIMRTNHTSRASLRFHRLSKHRVYQRAKRALWPDLRHKIWGKYHAVRIIG